MDITQILGYIFLSIIILMIFLSSMSANKESKGDIIAIVLMFIGLLISIAACQAFLGK
jgi:hypothetical protein